MEFEVGKIYEAQLGSKHGYSHIKARYIGYRSEEDSYIIEMISPIKWNGSITMLSLQRDYIKDCGHGIQFIVGADQILEEVKK